MASKKHNFPPPDAPDCVLCHDSGFNKHCGKWNFCGCVRGYIEKTKDPGAAAAMNFALGKLEGKTK